MIIRYFSIRRAVVITGLVFILVWLRFVINRTDFNKSFSRTNSSPFQSDLEKSPFRSRSNQRLFHLGQQFSHININKLLHIQTTSAQVLTYVCSYNCGGWGDRLRGITSSYVLAILLQRRFTIEMPYPCELSHFLLPNIIDWMPTGHHHPKGTSLRLDSIHSRYTDKLYSNISTIDLAKLWANFDHILLTTNSDYVTIALKNPFFQSIKSQLNIDPEESTQQNLFPFLFELLFRPTSAVMDNLDRLLTQPSLDPNRSIICMHVRLGRNPSVPGDALLPFRTSMVDAMIEFVDKNLSLPNSSIFITSDSYEKQIQVYKHYGSQRAISMPGPIIHIDRYDPKVESKTTLYAGFLKVISDFYFLGECDVLLLSRSGFSFWASRRRLNIYSNLYMYCRGMHRITGPNWGRPFTAC